MNALDGDDCSEVILCWASQTGKTEIALNTIGKRIDTDPGRILHMLPGEVDAEDFSRETVTPMIRDNPWLDAKIKPVKAKAHGTNVHRKMFPGGYWVLVGANVPAKLSRRPVRYLIADEVDRYGLSAGVEGSPIDLAEKRQSTFWNRKTLKISSPSVAGFSYIWQQLEESSHAEWHLDCPKCARAQVLTWSQLRFDKSPVTHKCKFCNRLSTESQWKAQPGHWRHRNPDRRAKRGYHLSALASPWVSWGELVTEWKTANANPEGQLRRNALQVFINTRLSECWEEHVAQYDTDKLRNRREYYHAEIPAGVKMLVAGADVQDDRIEVESVGYGNHRESWGIEYRVFFGDPRELLAAGSELDKYLTSKTWQYRDGGLIRLTAAGIDSGGHYTDSVYAYAAKRERQKIFSIRGEGGGGKPVIVRRNRTKEFKNFLITLGVDSIKTWLMKDIQIETTGPGFCHWPIEERGYQESYYDGLLSERPVIKRTPKGSGIFWEKKSGARNEPLDCRVYAFGILMLVDPVFDIGANRGKIGIKKRKVTGGIDEI